MVLHGEGWRDQGRADGLLHHLDDRAQRPGGSCDLPGKQRQLPAGLDHFAPPQHIHRDLQQDIGRNSNSFRQLRGLNQGFRSGVRPGFSKGPGRWPWISEPSAYGS
eukprot:12126827-Alexandrium_andersonii.AAC.1